MWSNDKRASRYGRLLVGLALYGFADALMVQAALGIGPWDVLAQGVSLRSGLLFGLVTNIIGLLVLLIWIPLRQRPGIGTLLNVLLVGTFQQLTIWLVPTPDGLLARILLFAAGLLLLAIATGIYVGAALGAGPRDGLMTGLHSRLGWPIWVGRTVVELVVLAAGWLLGGNVGLGTVAFALLAGPLCQLTIPLLASRSGRRPTPTVEPAAA
ncbi:YczE/YyaS/YitT family protein [Naasia lichenicola]|uniref:YitT family protein n=1 Tax=Naasia lichenicola TaxID=2565933 RepID=A0A4S4FHQ7_9MICO|nr:hypothetical protein [Naasia lichenicola]THG29558.1 hypothetical protein E6C64_12790 [Naasia lichenicola]